MKTNMRTEVQEYLRACKIVIGLAEQINALTVEETQAVASCSRELEKKLFPDPQYNPADATLSKLPLID